MIGLILGNIKSVLIAVGAVSMTVLALQAWDTLIDDPAVRTEARKEYVRISEFEAEKAKRETAEMLLELQKLKVQELEEARRTNAEALAMLKKALVVDGQNDQGLKDELEAVKNERSADTPVPTVGDIGIYDR